MTCPACVAQAAACAGAQRGSAAGLFPPCRSHHQRCFRLLGDNHPQQPRRPAHPPFHAIGWPLLAAAQWGRRSRGASMRGQALNRRAATSRPVLQRRPSGRDGTRPPAPCPSSGMGGAGAAHPKELRCLLMSPCSSTSCTWASSTSLRQGGHSAPATWSRCRFGFQP